MGRSQKQTKLIIETTELDLQALELRKLGYTYSKIGKAMGVSEVMAFKRVKRQLGFITEKLAESREENRRIEVERLDQMWLNLHDRDVDDKGNVKMIIRAKNVYTALLLMARRAKLMGLDEPDQVEVAGTWELIIGDTDDAGDTTAVGDTDADS